MYAANRVFYCVSGAWTDEWYDDPVAWWQWCCAFRGWTPEEWGAFYTRWRSASDRVRERMMDETGLRFFEWSRVPGGSIRGSTRVAASAIAEDLARIPAEADVTLIGHSKGGQAVKHVLAQVHLEPPSHPHPSRAVLVDAPLDWLRETAGRVMGLGIDRCRFSGQESRVPCVTINNWLDPSGGRLAGQRNYQTFVWQDYITPYPPHGLKGFLAERVLRDLGVVGSPRPQETGETAYASPAATRGGDLEETEG
jgi:hypothetical protein